MNTNHAIWRLYTEDTGAQYTPTLQPLAAKHLEAFTIFRGSGIWHGHFEPAAIIETVAPDTRETAERIAALASEIATVNHQETVLVVKLPVESVTAFGASNLPPSRD